MKPKGHTPELIADSSFRLVAETAPDYEREAREWEEAEKRRVKFEAQQTDMFTQPAQRATT